jgi:anti-sigma B factor antagonist
MEETTTAFGVREAAPEVQIIDVQGEVTPATEDALTAAYEQASVTAQAIVLNFGGLTYMNSGGIGLLVTLLVRAQRSKQRMLAYGLSDHYRQILQLTRLDEAIAIHDSETAAVAAG